MNISHVTDEYMGLVKVKPDDPYIHRFPYPVDENKVIFVSFKTDKYNLNIFLDTDEYKCTNE
jgi:hypothetical protein